MLGGGEEATVEGLLSEVGESLEVKLCMCSVWCEKCEQEEVGEEEEEGGGGVSVGSLHALCLK